MNDRRPPNRLAHIHPMRTAGTFLAAYLSDALRADHDISHSWIAGLERDWTAEELRTLSERPGPMYVHNHVANWSRDLVHHYQRAGFFAFAFVRDVGDQLCSLHYWLLKRERERHLMTLDDFIRGQLAGESVFGIDYRHWQAPPYWEELDFVCVFDADNFGAFRQMLGTPDPPDRLALKAANASKNLGWPHYCETGQVTAETQERVTQSVFQQRVQAIIRRGLPDQIGSAAREAVRRDRRASIDVPRRKKANYNMAKLPSCDYRVETPDAGVFYCRHSGLYARNNLVTPPICKTCTLHSQPCSQPRPLPTPEELKSPPPLVRQAWNLVGSLAAFVADGFQTVTNAEYERRRQICDGCDERRGNRCLQCGCNLTLKAQGRAFQCKPGYWDRAEEEQA